MIKKNNYRRDLDDEKMEDIQYYKRLFLKNIKWTWRYIFIIFQDFYVYIKNFKLLIK